MLETIEQAALITLEKLVNKAVKLDTYTEEQLKQLLNKTISFTFTDIQRSLVFHFLQNRILILKHTQENTDLSFSCDIKTFLKQLSHFKEGHKSMLPGMRVQGDIHLAQTVQSILSRLDIDWESHLASIFGHQAAHGIAKIVKSLFNFGKQASHNFSQSLREYILEEARLSPSKQALDDFYQDISQLRLSIDRLNLRIKRLSNKE